MSMHAYSFLGCCSRIFLQREPEVPEDIKLLFEKYSENGEMDDEHLHKFLKEVQSEDRISREETKALMQTFIHEHKHLYLTHGKKLDVYGFLRFLMSEVNSPLPLKVHHDMDAPLSHYFIYTSHNTYLKGNQLTSKCSDKPVINALKRGVRVIELDIWPNSREDDVIVKHGGTATRPVKLIKCLRAIRRHAFDASEYSLIITFEDHLSGSPHLQNKVAAMVTETFSDKLYHAESFEEFPSPEKLKGTVIITTKLPKECLETKKEGCNGTAELHQSEKNWGFVEKLPCCKVTVDREWDLSNYRSVIAIPKMKMKGGLEAWLSNQHQNAHRVSLSEQKLEDAVTTYGAKILRFNWKNLMRVYPKGTRIFSSNYDPFVGWTRGVQMVAFNMQGYDWPLWVMQGMFRANGGCGYVKKPEFLLKDGHDNELCDPTPKKRLRVKLYMGDGWHLEFHRTHFDWFSPPDFYVKIGVAGVNADPQLQQTRTVENNWKPVWNEEFEFPLPVPELAILRVEVHERDTYIGKKDDFGGQTCLPVWELKTGIRAVPLHSKRGDKYRFVKLLMEFEFI